MKNQHKLFILLMAIISIGSVQGQTDGSQFLAIFGKPLEEIKLDSLSKLQKEKVHLGKLLYFEKRLSKDNSISCNSCHDTTKFGVDGEKFSVGFKNHLTGRNSPTSFNAFLHISQFWDGRAKDVEEQAKGPILAAGEMAMPSAEAVVAKLKKIDGYHELFKAAFPDAKDPLTYDNVGKAIGAYERLFVTPSRFDKALGGDKDALTKKEYSGLSKFVSNGCIACHTGNLLGGNMYQKLGLVEAWPNQKDQGRFDLTKKPEDKMMFKVPSLRNIAKTGPYFHDGSAKDLVTAIKLMGKHQLGKEISDQDAKEIEVFLKSLTGQLNKDIAKAPESFPGLAKAESSGIKK